MEYTPSYNDSLRADILPSYTDSLVHYGVKGMHWGIRRYQNRDGSYTSKGKKHRKTKTSLIDAYNSLDDKTKRNISLGIAAVGTGIAAKSLYDSYKPEIEAAIIERKGGYDSQGISKKYDKTVKNSFKIIDKDIQNRYIEASHSNNSSAVRYQAEEIHNLADDAARQFNKIRDDLYINYDLSSLSKKDTILLNKNVNITNDIAHEQIASWHSLAYALNKRANEIDRTRFS